MKIEIPVGSNIKYEIDKDTGEVKVDRILSLTYPATYGYIKGTLADDNDPLDVFLLGDLIFTPGAVIEVEILGMIEMEDRGERDNKLIAQIPGSNFSYNDINGNIGIISEFLKHYKHGAIVGQFVDQSVAIRYYKYCEDRYEA